MANIAYINLSRFGGEFSSELQTWIKGTTSMVDVRETDG